MCWLCCVFRLLVMLVFYFFFNDTATTEIYTLSLHDALPISTGRPSPRHRAGRRAGARARSPADRRPAGRDRKSTRLNSSLSQISYAVFCLKKKKNIITIEFTSMLNTLPHTRDSEHAHTLHRV